MAFEHLFPNTIVLKENAVYDIGEYASRYGRRVFVVVGRRFARKYGYVDLIANSLKSRGLDVELYEGVKPNPDTVQCDEIALRLKEFRADVVVAFGGGSVIDAAKAASVVATLGGKTSDYFYPRAVSEEIIPIIAIPTTCGTGSEVTRYAVITDPIKQKKMTIVGSSIIPRIAILDVEVLRHLPKELVTWTALDALSHAIEAILSRKATVLSNSFAIQASKTILNNIIEAVKGSKEALKKLHVAATLAGLAINTTGTNIVHALGYYLTTKFGIHHGLANAVLLPYFIEELLDHIPRNTMRILLEIFNVDTPHSVVEKLLSIYRQLEIPSLRSLGVTIDRVEEHVGDAYTYRRNLENALVDVDKDILKRILIRAHGL